MKSCFAIFALCLAGHFCVNAPERSPAGDTKEPMGEKKDPAGDKKDPAGEKKDPIGEKKDPAGDKNDPMGDKKDPAEIVFKRGPEHKILKSLEGDYDAKVVFFTVDPKGPVEFAGTMTRTMILNENFLQESFKGKLPNGEFLGLGMIGYDSLKQKYVTTWFDNLQDSTAQMQGTYDAKTKTFTTTCEDVDASGRKMKSRDVLRIVSDDEQVFQKWWETDGPEKARKVIEITYTRRKRGI
jgi:hypothetical protein